MPPETNSITWEAPEHYHIEKSSDWFWALGIITIAAVIAAFFFGNTLFALLLGVGGFVLGLFATKEPKIIPYAVTMRGLRVGDSLFPYTTLVSFYLDEDDPIGPQLLARTTRTFSPLIVMPIPPEYVDDIESILTLKLPEEYLEEPFINKLLEFLGF